MVVVVVGVGLGLLADGERKIAKIATAPTATAAMSIRSTMLRRSISTTPLPVEGVGKRRIDHG